PRQRVTRPQRCPGEPTLVGDHRTPIPGQLGILLLQRFPPPHLFVPVTHRLPVSPAGGEPTLRSLLPGGPRLGDTAEPGRGRPAAAPRAADLAHRSRAVRVRHQRLETVATCTDVVVDPHS